MSPASPAVRPVLLLLALAVILAGALARPFDLDRMVVWHDEVFSVLRVFGHSQPEAAGTLFSARELAPDDLLRYQRPVPEHGWGDTLAALMEHPEHAPLYYLSARAVSDLPGLDPIVALRGTSALFSLLLMPAMAWLAWELYGERRAAWIAAALAAASPIHLLYAQEARQYALWAVLAAAASAALLRALRRGARRDWVLYALLAGVGLWSHVLTALVLAAHGAFGLFSAGHPQRALAFLGRWVPAIGGALILFSPWLYVMLQGAEEVQRFTGWMERPIPAARAFEAWGLHLVRVFADLPVADRLLLLGLIPLAWVLWRFLRAAPWRALLFNGLLFAGFAAAVLGQDLILGGSRSLHPRYIIPAFLAVQLAAAWVLARGWDASTPAGRLAGRVGLMAVLGLGLVSQWQILSADTWWSKNYSQANHRVAGVINAADRPLVLASDTGVGLGEVLSLAYDLKPEARVWGEPAGSALVPAGPRALFAVTPSGELRAQLGDQHHFEALEGTWQWFRVVPKTPPVPEPSDDPTLTRGRFTN